MEDNNIEILDIDSNENDEIAKDKSVVETKDENKLKKVKKRRLKKGIVQIIFCFVSFLFITNT